MSAPILSVRGLSITGVIEGATRTIVRDLDLEVHAGETLGIVGESGSGKSMTARALIGLPPPGVQVAGSIELDGRELVGVPETRLARLRGAEITLVLQDPFTMLDPRMRCGHQIAESLVDERRSRTAIREEVLRRLREVGIGDPTAADRYPFQLSGGMRQRVALAAALARDPRILIADEPTTGLDVTTQREVLGLLRALQRSRSMALVFITHDLGVAFDLCDRVSVLYAGSVLEEGPSSTLGAEPGHPYTLALLLAQPRIDGRTEALWAAPGSVPTPDEVRDICAFAPRCTWVDERCTSRRPSLETIEAGHRSACLRIGEIRDDVVGRRREAARFGVVRPTAAPTTEVLRVEGVGKVFTQRSRGRVHHVTALEDVSLTVGAGECVGLVGESGSGKTTLGRCIVGLETPDSGTITVSGVHVERFGALPRHERRRARAAAQIVFQDPYSTLNPWLTIGSTLREVIALQGDGRDPRRASLELLRQVGLSERHAARKPAALSGGERQRVAIARALAVRPRLLVCDEPVSALDVSVQAQILTLLRSLQEELGLSFLFITHDLGVVRQVADRVSVLYRGRIVEEGPTADVIDRPTHPYTRLLRESALGSAADSSPPPSWHGANGGRPLRGPNPIRSEVER